jgi:Domain of unknown function (DUF4129)
MMHPRRPRKTLADYLVVGASPVLIVLLVGSLVFFLIQVFYRGGMAGGLRWVMFWFVLAIVLVSRIGIEQGPGHAAVYGLALAIATWLYLVRTHPAYLLGVVLLAIVWWCANRLTRDCTLIDDDADASGRGLLELATERTRGKQNWPGPEDLPGDTAQRRGRVANPVGGLRGRTPRLARTDGRREGGASPHAPGLSVIYFSLAALPLFGIGQVLLPAGDTDGRRVGFGLLVVYLAAALGLLLTTSFLGLRRYLRQRYLRMPAAIAFGWVQFGAGLAVAVLLLALLLPRPGADYTWRTLAYRIDSRLRRASEVAMRFNPPGKGSGAPGNQAKPIGHQEGSGPATGAPVTAGSRAGSHRSAGPAESQPQPAGGPSSVSPGAMSGQAARSYRMLRRLLVVAGVLLVLTWLVRHRRMLLEIVRSFLQSLAELFRTLMGFSLQPRASRPTGSKQAPMKRHPFASYKNPFATGKDRVWRPEAVIAYTFEALQAWAQEQGIELQAPRTPREFCDDVGDRFPEVASGAHQLAYLYGHAAYGRRLPERCDLEPVRELWRYLSASVAGVRALR